MFGIFSSHLSSNCIAMQKENLTLPDSGVNFFFLGGGEGGRSLKKICFATERAVFYEILKTQKFKTKVNDLRVTYWQTLLL